MSICFAPKLFLFYELRTQAADGVNLKTRSRSIPRDLLPGAGLVLRQEVCVFGTKIEEFCYLFPLALENN